MIRYETVAVPATTKSVQCRVECDLCGRKSKWGDSAFTASESDF